MRLASGFSLVECVVASVLCAAGLLALSGATRAMLDLAALGDRTAGAAQVAASRLASLRTCLEGPGEATHGAFRERWSVTLAGPSRSAMVDVTFAVGGRARTVRYEAILPCPA